ncbi:MAG: hypothetical protein ACRDTS_03800, partial [Mycobacterium sp.]
LATVNSAKGRSSLKHGSGGSGPDPLPRRPSRRCGGLNSALYEAMFTRATTLRFAAERRIHKV